MRRKKTNASSFAFPPLLSLFLPSNQGAGSLSGALRAFHLLSHQVSDSPWLQRHASSPQTPSIDPLHTRQWHQPWTEPHYPSSVWWAKPDEESLILLESKQLSPPEGTSFTLNTHELWFSFSNTHNPKNPETDLRGDKPNHPISNSTMPQNITKSSLPPTISHFTKSPVLDLTIDDIIPSYIRSRTVNRKEHKTNQRLVNLAPFHGLSMS